MTNRNIGVYILFKADASQAKAATTEVKAAVASVTDATRAQAQADARAATTIEQVTSTRKRQTEATRAQVVAERQAREAAITAATSGAATALPAAAFDTSALTRDTTAWASSLAGELRQTTAVVHEAGTALQSLQPRTAAAVGGFLKAAAAGAAWRAELTMIRERLNPAVAAHRELQEAINSVETAEAVGAITAREASVAIDQLSRAMIDLQARAQTAGVSLTEIGPATRQATTAMQALIERQTGFTAASTASTAATLRHGQALDDLRARFNPLFAVSRAYEQELRDIADAERQNAITAGEAAAARERAAQAMAPVNRGGVAGGGAASAYTMNLGFQANDIAMMTMIGQSPGVMAMQQGPQVVQIFNQMKSAGMAIGPAVAASISSLINPMALVTIGAIAGGAALVQWAMSAISAGKDTRSFGEVLESLSAAIDRYRSANDQARRSTIELKEEFGSAADAAGELMQRIAERERRGIERDLTALRKEIPKEMGIDLRPHLELGQLRGQEHDLLRSFGLSGWREESWQTARSIVAAFREVEKATTLDEQIAAVQELHGLYLQAAEAAGGISKQEDAHLAKIQQTLQGLLRLRGADENSKGATALSRMIADFEREAELAAAVLAYGENSAQVEAIRADHAREALRIRLEDLKVEKDSGDAGRAREALEARLATDADAATAKRRKAARDIVGDLTRQAEVSQAILRHGEEAVEVELVRERHARELLGARTLEAGLGWVLAGQAQALLAAEQDRLRTIKEMEGTRSADRMMVDLIGQAAINAAILQHGENSIQVKELQIAAERRLHEESLKTLKVSEARKEELRRQWELTNGLASDDPFGRLAAARDRDRSHADSLARLELELRLVGQTSTMRARALAIHEAEVRMRREGYDLGSQEIEIEKARAAALADITTELERQRDAWDKVHRAAEGMIDGPIDALLKGDLKGALSSVVEEVAGLWSELALKNPLKNRLLGTNYATLDDVGGLGGIVGRLFGGAQAEP
ncbi:phage tail length tape measure family protein, partial [Ruixingdingia sedimenti]